ncbi:MAG: NADH-quinone oxidoreductase subunit NuoE [Ignavibacteriae bacterium]|nr:NADH-quinone oxidoreductase subunit NuoE [Ignavibacteriota bacterium]
MLVLEKNSITEEIEALVVEHGSERSALMPILQAVQAKHRYVPDFAQQEIARLLDIHPVEVFSVISFYSFLHSEPQGRNIVRLCRTIVCDLAGKTEVEKAVMRELKINVGETTTDKKVTLEHTNCLGMCDQGPAMMVNDRIYTKLTPEKAVGILKIIK